MCIRDGERHLDVDLFQLAPQCVERHLNVDLFQLALQCVVLHLDDALGHLDNTLAAKPGCGKFSVRHCSSSFLVMVVPDGV